MCQNFGQFLDNYCLIFSNLTWADLFSGIIISGTEFKILLLLFWQTSEMPLHPLSGMPVLSGGGFYYKKWLQD